MLGTFQTLIWQANVAKQLFFYHQKKANSCQQIKCLICLKKTDLGDNNYQKYFVYKMYETV